MRSFHVLELLELPESLEQMESLEPLRPALVRPWFSVVILSAFALTGDRRFFITKAPVYSREPS